MGVEALTKRQGRIEPFLCHRRLVEMDQKILDHHRLLPCSKSPRFR